MQDVPAAGARPAAGTVYGHISRTRRARPRAGGAEPPISMHATDGANGDDGESATCMCYP